MNTAPIVSKVWSYGDYLEQLWHHPQCIDIG